MHILEEDYSEVVGHIKNPRGKKKKKPERRKKSGFLR